MVPFSPFSKLIDLILPPRCLSCQKIVTEDKTLCMDCWGQANFITPPFCKCCGLPFEIDVPGEAICLDCAQCRPLFKTARAVFPYDDFSRQMILAYKHGDRTDLAPTFAKWMYQASQETIETCDLIVPVPLHWRRLGMRRFNQAALICRELSRLSSKPCCMDMLKRTRHTLPQGHLSRMARQKNLQGAFSVTKNCNGKNIILVDDVLTTGATLLNCTNALLRAGARDVHCLIIARVVHN